MRLEEFDIHTERDLLKLDKKSPREISKQLKSMGFKEVSRGHFGQVFILNRGNRVVKVSMKSDTGYEMFLDLAMRNTSNPHLPKISWKQNFTYIDNGVEKPGFMVALERLAPIPMRDYYPTKQFVTQHADQFAVLNAIEKSGMGIELYVPIDYIPKSQLEKSNTEFWAHPLYKAFDKLINTFGRGKIKSDLVWDLHWKNIMYRPSDGSLVVTDPFAAQSEITL